MAATQPFGISCKGGLNTNLNQIELLGQPGSATQLRNFEVDPDGGYRRISGFSQFGDGTDQILTMMYMVFMSMQMVLLLL